MGSVVSGAVALAVVLLGKSVDGRVAGLAIVYAMNFAENFTYMARAYSDCQMTMNSVERVMEYLVVDKEIYEPAPSRLADSFSEDQRWPPDGSVEFKNLCLRYRSTSPLVLK